MELEVVAAMARKMLSENGLTDWRFVWDRAQRRGGQCSYTNRTISMSRLLVPNWTEEQVKDILAHEVAHALTRGHHHDQTWAAMARALGGTGDRTHANETVPGKWAAFCDKCDPTKPLAGRYHRLHPRRRTATHRACGTRVRWVDTSLVPV